MTKKISLYLDDDVADRLEKIRIRDDRKSTSEMAAVLIKRAIAVEEANRG